jgi:hypothetical protein
MPSKYCLMLRSAQQARLEARTASLQLIFAASINFLTASFAGATENARFIPAEHEGPALASGAVS